MQENLQAFVRTFGLLFNYFFPNHRHIQTWTLIGNVRNPHSRWRQRWVLPLPTNLEFFFFPLVWHFGNYLFITTCWKSNRYPLCKMVWLSWGWLGLTQWLRSILSFSCFILSFFFNLLVKCVTLIRFFSPWVYLEKVACTLWSWFGNICPPLANTNYIHI